MTPDADFYCQKPKPEFNTSCEFFAMFGRGQRPFCRSGFNKKVTIQGRGQPYDVYIADCSRCERNK